MILSTSASVFLTALFFNFAATFVYSVPVNNHGYVIDPSRYAFAPESAREWLYPDPSHPISGRYSRQLTVAYATTNNSANLNESTTKLSPSTTITTTTEKSTSSSNNEPLDTLRGCYHQGRFVHERSLIQPKDSCMNCTCANGIVQCQLTLCTLYRNIPDGCQLVRHESQCCPALECVNGNADGSSNSLLLSSTEAALTASSTAAGLVVVSAEDVIKQKQVQFQIPAGNDTSECKKNGFMYQNGDFVPSPDPCEACYCLRETVRCVTQRCELPEDTRQGCLPVYMDGICCPVRYQCGKTQLSEDPNVQYVSSTTTTTLAASTTTTEMATTTTTAKLLYNTSLADQRFELPRSDATFFHMDELKPMQRDTTNNITVIEISHVAAPAGAAVVADKNESAKTVITINNVVATTTTASPVPTSVGFTDAMTQQSTTAQSHHETDPELADYALIDQDEPSTLSTSKSPVTTGTVKKQLQSEDEVELPLERPRATTVATSSLTTTFTTARSTAAEASTTPASIVAFADTPKAKAIQILLEQKENEPDVEFDEPAALEQIESAIQEKALNVATLAAIINQTRIMFEQAGRNRTNYQIPLSGTNITITNTTMNEMMEMIMNATTTEASTTTERNDTAYRVPLAGADILAMLENMTTTEMPANETMSTTTELATTTERNDTAYRVPIAGADILAMLMNMTGEGETNDTTVATTPSTTTVSTTPGIKMIIPLRSAELNPQNAMDATDIIITDRAEKPPAMILTTQADASEIDRTTPTSADYINKLLFHSATTNAPEQQNLVNIQKNVSSGGRPNSYLLEILPTDLLHNHSEQQALNQKVEQSLNQKLSSDGDTAIKVQNVTLNGTSILNAPPYAAAETTNLVLVKVNMSNAVATEQKPMDIIEVTARASASTTQSTVAQTSAEELTTSAFTTPITTSTEATTTTTTTESNFYMGIDNKIHTRRPSPTTTTTSTTAAPTKSTTVQQQSFSTNAAPVAPLNVTIVELPKQNAAVSSQLVNDIVMNGAAPIVTNLTVTNATIDSNLNVNKGQEKIEAVELKSAPSSPTSTVAILLPPNNQSSVLILKVAGNETAEVKERIVLPIIAPEHLTAETTTQSISDDDVVVPLRPGNNRSAPNLILVADHQNEVQSTTTTAEPMIDTTQAERQSFLTTEQPTPSTESPHQRAVALLDEQKANELDVEFDEPAALEQIESAIQEKALNVATLAAIINQTRIMFEQAGRNRTNYQIPLSGTNITITNTTMNEMMEMIMNATTTEASTTTERNDTAYRVPLAGADILAMLENMTTTEMPANETMSTTTELATTTERNDTAYRVPIAGADILAMLMNMTGEGETNDTTVATTPSTTTVSTTPGIKMIIPLRMGEIGITINSSDPALQDVTIGMLKQTASESVAEVLNNATSVAARNETVNITSPLNQSMKMIGEQAGVQIVGMPLAAVAAVNISEAPLQSTARPQSVTVVAGFFTSTISTEQTTESTVKPSTSTTTESSTTRTTAAPEQTTSYATTRPRTARPLVAAGVPVTPSTTLRPQTTTILAPITIEAVRGRQRGSLTRIVSLEPIQDGHKVTVKSQINLGDKSAIGGCLLDGQLYSNYQAIPLAELHDPCIVRICKDGVIYGPSMQRCPPAIDGCLPTQVVGVCCPVYLCPTIIERNDNSTTLTRPLGSAESLFVMNETSAAQLSRNYVCRINSRFMTINERVIRVAQDKCQTCECKHNGIVCEPGCGKNQLISSPDLIGELALGLSVNLDVNQNSIKADTPPPLTPEQQLQQQTTAAPLPQQLAEVSSAAIPAGGIAGQRGCQIKEKYYKHGEDIDFADECHTCTCYDSLVNCRINKDKCNALVRRRRRFDFLSNILLVRPIVQ